MTIWAHKTFPTGEWFATQALFEKQFMALHGPADMLLVHVDGEDRKTDRIIVGLPNKVLLPMYDGFEEVPAAHLPKSATLLVGHVPSFEERFQYKSNNRDRASS